MRDETRLSARYNNLNMKHFLLIFTIISSIGTLAQARCGEREMRALNAEVAPSVIAYRSGDLSRERMEWIAARYYWSADEIKKSCAHQKPAYDDTVIDSSSDTPPDDRILIGTDRTGGG